MQKYGMVLVTPKMATQYLAKKVENRKISIQHVRKLKEAMERGEWLENGVSIILDKKGFVLDGQHRLTALIEYGKPLKMCICKGVDKEAYTTIDIGKKRTPADMLSLRGEKDCNALGAVLRLYNCYTMNSLNKPQCGSTYISPKQTETILDKNPGIRKSVRYAVHNKKEIRLVSTGTLIATFHYIFGKKNKKHRDEYFDGLLFGANLGKTNPIFHLRNMLLKKRARYSSRDLPEIISSMIKAWNNRYYGAKEDFKYNSEDKVPKVLG